MVKFSLLGVTEVNMINQSREGRARILTPESWEIWSHRSFYSIVLLIEFPELQWSYLVMLRPVVDKYISSLPCYWLRSRLSRNVQILPESAEIPHVIPGSDSSFNGVVDQQTSSMWIIVKSKMSQWEIQLPLWTLGLVFIVPAQVNSVIKHVSRKIYLRKY